MIPVDGIMKLLNVYIAKSAFVIPAPIHIIACTQDMSSIRLLLHQVFLPLPHPPQPCQIQSSRSQRLQKKTLHHPKAGKSVKATEKAWTASKGCCPASSSVGSDLSAETLKKVKTIINPKVSNKGLSSICLQFPSDYFLYQELVSVQARLVKRLVKTPERRPPIQQTKMKNWPSFVVRIMHLLFSIIHILYKCSPNWALWEGNTGLLNNCYNEQCCGNQDTPPFYCP